MRKLPRQERSRQMVERIIDAGRTVLLEDGYDAFSTNRVARVAGVSPGSLYQYFPDKASIMEVVIERYWEQVADRVAASLADRIGSSGPAMVRDTADALIAALEADRPLLRVVAEELPVAENKHRRALLEQRVREMMAAYLAARPATNRRPDAGTAAWVLVLALEALVTRWVLDEPAIEREALIEEILALVDGYLVVSPESPGTEPSSESSAS